MNGWKRAILEMAETSKRVEIVLILVGRFRVAWSCAAQRPTNDLTRAARGGDGFGGVKRYVRDRTLFRDASDHVGREAADGECCFVDMCEDVIKALAGAHVSQCRVLKEVRDASVEHAEAHARRDERGSEERIFRREERLALR